MILVVDDTRVLDLPNAFHAKTIWEALVMLAHIATDHRGAVIEAIYLDHDLGDDGDIRPLVEVMAAKPEGFPEIQGVYVHSMNVIGAEWIMQKLDPHYKVVRVTPRQLVMLVVSK